MKRVKLSEINKSSDVITNSERALDYLKQDLDLSQENVVLIGVDTKNQVKFTKTLFKGGVNSSIIDLKLIVRDVLINSCSGFIIGHNHPSGNLEPSFEDKDITSKLKKVCGFLDLRLLDHVIFDNEKYISFFEENLL